MPLITQTLSCNLERSLHKAPKFNECMRHIFAERARTAPATPLPPSPSPAPSSPYIQQFFFLLPLLLKRTPCRPCFSQRLQRKYIMCKRNPIWCHTICVIPAQIIKRKLPSYPQFSPLSEALQLLYCMFCTTAFFFFLFLKRTHDSPHCLCLTLMYFLLT